MAVMAGAMLDLMAPIPQPHPYGLLSAATLVDPASDRWLGGAWTGGDVPGPVHTHDPCDSGTNRVKADPNEMVTQMNGRFVAYLPALCTAQSIGPEPEWYTDRLRLAFQAYEGAAVERALATGDGHPTIGSWLANGNMEDLGGGVVTSLRGLELLEDEIALNGGGIIHATPATATAWAADSLIAPRGGVMRTVANGTPVAIGPGYLDVDPDGAATPAADQAWAFASGPIEVYQGELFINPSNYREAIDRSMNDVMFYAERPYLFNWIARQDSSDDDHTQAGVLIDLVP